MYVCGIFLHENSFFCFEWAYVTCTNIFFKACTLWMQKKTFEIDFYHREQATISIHNLGVTKKSFKITSFLSIQFAKVILSRFIQSNFIFGQKILNVGWLLKFWGWTAISNMRNSTVKTDNPDVHTRQHTH